MMAALDRLPCGLLTLGDDGRILAVNQTLCAMLGYAREELLPEQHVQILLTALKTWGEARDATSLISVLVAGLDVGRGRGAVLRSQFASATSASSRPSFRALMRPDASAFCTARKLTPGRA